MDIVQEPVIKNAEYKDNSHIVGDWFLMGSPIPITLIMTAYLLFVLKIGPEFMKNRKPFKLQKILLVYNIVQVYFSLALVKLSYGMISEHGLLPTSCITDSDEHIEKVSAGIHFYFLVKIGELLDTIFFVLRKKDNQVTFLHVYHHSLVVISGWIVLKYEPTYLVIYLGWINALVHVIMYTYYGLAAFPSLTKYLWWKRYITRLQIIQFGTIIVHYFLSYKTSECKPSIAISINYLVNLNLFIYLFGKFYINSYMKKNQNKDKHASKLPSSNKTDEEEIVKKHNTNIGSNEQQKNRNRNTKSGH